MIHRLPQTILQTYKFKIPSFFPRLDGLLRRISRPIFQLFGKVHFLTSLCCCFNSFRRDTIGRRCFYNLEFLGVTCSSFLLKGSITFGTPLCESQPNLTWSDLTWPALTCLNWVDLTSFSVEEKSLMDPWCFVKLRADIVLCLSFKKKMTATMSFVFLAIPLSTFYVYGILKQGTQDYVVPHTTDIHRSLFSEFS